MKISLLKIHHRSWRDIVVIILLFAFIALMYIHGKHYPQCICIFPDEVLDLQGCNAPVRIEDIRTISAEQTEKMEFVSAIELEVFSSFSFYHINDHFPLEYPIIKSFRNRLFLLQHYNSWNLIPLIQIWVKSSVRSLFLFLINKQF